MDKIIIKKLQAKTVVGVLPWERELAQTLYFTMELQTEASRAARTDAITEALDYRAVVEKTHAWLATQTFFLIETLAEQLAQMLLSSFQTTWVRVELTKPSAIPKAEGVSVMIERNKLPDHATLL